MLLIHPDDSLALSSALLGNVPSLSEAANLLDAVQQVIFHETPQVLSQALNHYVIPIRTPVMERLGTPYMQQQAAVSPLAVFDADGVRQPNRAVVCGPWSVLPT